MSEQPLIEELTELAQQVAECPDETVADLGADIAAWYRRERLVALGLAAVDSMVNDDPKEIGEDDPRLGAVRVQLRDRLRNLLAWARESGRM